MARILICHVPKDGSLARDLGAALMGRGHFVSFDGEPDSPRPERASRLRQFEAVIVLWTEASAQTAGLTDIAREVLPLNLLVPVRAEELATTRLPLMFRKLNMLAPRDIDGIVRVVARMSTAASSLRDMTEREAARRAAGEMPSPQETSRNAVRMAPAPPPVPRQRASAPRGTPGIDPRRSQPGLPPAAGPVAQPGAGVRVRPLSDLPEVDAGPNFAAGPDSAPSERTPVDGAGASRGRTEKPRPRPSTQVLTADDLARAVEAGLLVHHIPAAMWLGAPTTVELTLGRDVLARLFQAEPGYGGRGQCIETLSVSLYGSSEAFEIERQSERTQFVSAKHALSARDPATFGRWAWLVTPCAGGPQDLVVRISALLRDCHGVPAPVALPDRRFSVDVRVPEDESLVSGLAGWDRR